MGPLFCIFLGLAIAQAKSCPGCAIEIAQDNAKVFLEQLLIDRVPAGLEPGDKPELVRINSVKKQVVSGILYRYDFEVRGSSSQKMYQCRLKVITKGYNEDLTDFSCSQAPQSANSVILGGETEMDLTGNSDFNKFESVIGQEITKAQNSKYAQRVVRVFKATKQVVAGLNIKTTVEVASTNCLQNEVPNVESCKVQKKDRQICDVHLWVKPWENKNQVVSLKCRPHPHFCAGCPVKIDSNDDSVRQLLERTLSNMNAESSDELLSLVKIRKATSQVVAGAKYDVDFDAKEQKNGKLLSCKAIIITQPWISNEPSVNYFHCEANKTE